MSNIKSKGLILKQTAFGEANRMLTVFCEDLGIIQVSAYGAKSAKGRRSAALQFMAYSEFVLKKGKGDILTVESAEAIDSFFPAQEDIRVLSLLNYFSEITCAALGQNVEDNNLLHLLLNTVYVCAYNKVPCALAKAVYELRLAKNSGYMPELASCLQCGREVELPYFSYNGGLVCEGCAKKSPAIPIDTGCLHALTYILHADDKKMFSFQVSDAVLERLSILAETYLLKHLDRDFKSLEYYKKII